MNILLKLACLVGMATALSAQTPTQIDVSRVKGAAQLGSDGKVLPSQLPVQTGGGSGSGASQTAQLLDWKFTRVSPTRLQFGDNCLPGSPCNVDIGGVVSAFVDGPYHIDVSGANSGSVCIYVLPTNQLTVGIGGGLTTADITGSSSLAFVGGINSCPPDSAKLATWNVTGGSYANYGSALASYLSYKPSPLSGTGIQIVTGARDTIQVDTTSVIRKFMVSGAPANVSGSTKGDIAYDTASAPPVMYQCKQPACVQASDWASIGIGGAGLSAGAITLQDNAGNVVGTRGVLQSLNGSYITCTLGDTGIVLTEQCDADTAKLVDRTKANTWTAGARQTFQASASTPALKLAPSALPLSGAAGDLAVLNTDNSLNVFDGSAWNKAATTAAGLTNGAPLIGLGGNKIGVAATTGTGGTLVLAAAPVLSLPVISDFSNAGHGHTSAAMGGTLSLAAILAPFSGCNSANPLMRYDGACSASGGGGGAPGGASGQVQINSGGSFAGTSAVPVCARHTIAVSNGNYTLDGGGVTAIPGAVSTFDVAVFTMPAMGKLVGLTMKHGTAFTGVANQNAVNGVVAGVGLIAPVTNRIAYSNGTLDVGSATSGANLLDIGGHYSATHVSHTVTATFSSSCSSGNCFIAGLTGGSLDIWACTVTLP